MYLGSGTVRAGEPERTYTVSGNVYLPEAPQQNAPMQGLPQLANDLYNRPQYLGQFWVGVVGLAGPVAVLQLRSRTRSRQTALGQFERTPPTTPSTPSTPTATSSWTSAGCTP